MSLPLPLAVRLRTVRNDRHITRDLRDLTYRSVAPGGFASATVSLHRPLHLQPDEIGYYARLYVYDIRSAEVVWEGRVEDLGRQAGPDGAIWDIAAVGPSAHARDRTLPLIYVDARLDGFTRTMPSQAVTNGDVSPRTDPGDASGIRPALLLSIPQGQSVVNGDRLAFQYQRIWRAGQKIARIDYSWDAGFTAGGWLLETSLTTDGSYAGGDLVRSDAANTAGGGSSPKVVVTDYSNGRNTLSTHWINTGGSSTCGVFHWTDMFNVAILAMRYNADGTEKTTGYTTNTVLASDVVADLLGRVLTAYDGAGAAIATTSFAIDQLAYPDATTAAQVLDDLMALDPGYYWAAWASNPASDAYQFEWSAWPTVVTYEAGIADGYDAPSSAADLFSAVRVRYLDAVSSTQTVQRMQTVQALTDAGLVREAFIDLSDSVGSAANAQQAGDRFLAEHASAPNAGRLHVARPIVNIADLSSNSAISSGAPVMPWQIRPGKLIRVRGLTPSVDSLNPVGRDGVTIFRIVAVTFRAADATAELELDTYPVTIAHALARVGPRLAVDRWTTTPQAARR